MNTNQTNKVTSAPRGGTFVEQCLSSCRKMLAQLERAKDAIAAEFGGLLGAHQPLLHLALNEAEALAWETEYPHLVFPTLAAEKAQELAAWHARQITMQRSSSRLALAA